jgi:DNA-binding XRE family transcriptional regulator
MLPCGGSHFGRYGCKLNEPPGGKAFRLRAGWSQEELADAAEVSVPTIKRLEAHDGALGGRHETGPKIRLALETAGVEFIDENAGGPGVRLRKRRGEKSRS